MSSQRKLEMRSIFGLVELRRDYFYFPDQDTGRFPLVKPWGW
jgi:hypothetical protein